MGPPNLLGGGTNAISSSKSKSSVETERVAEEGIGFERAVPSAPLSEAHRWGPNTVANVRRSDRSEDDYHLEGTSIPQTARQKPKSDLKTTVNNTGAFHDSNLSHINQGYNGTVNQGSSFSINRNHNIFNVSGSMVNEDGLSGLNLLKEFVAFDALYDSSAQDPKRRCHPGTRESVLQTMRNWIDNPNAQEKIFWLHGPAGVGKSAIAQTISHSYEPDKVAATFFFFRSDPNRNDGNRLFPTLAWQLAFSIPHAKKSFSLALNENPDLPRKAIEIQFQRLLVRPLQGIGPVPQVQTSAPVIIVDGVDECTDNELQKRFLETVGKAAMAGHTPLRFLISSRPEAHIRECLDQLQCPVLQIDLADLNEVFRDVERYLTTEFAQIAFKRKINPETWPGQKVIKDLVSRSSGQFIYVATIIKFVGDEYENAKSQLDIILGLQPSDGKSPFADLDVLYMEILQRQRHQDFLKDFLATLIGRTSSGEFLGRDDALLLKTDEEGLHRKLRGMHSLLKIKLGSDIDVYHQSFLDFLLDPLRSGRYHISQHSGRRRFLELIVAAIVRHASKVIGKPDYHGSEHFTPQFSFAVRRHPRRIDLPLQDWEETLRPLLILREEMLKLSTLSNPTSPWKHGFCDDCSVLYTVDDLLLHLLLIRGDSHARSRPSQYEDPPWYSRSLGNTMTKYDEHRGKQRNCVTTRTSEGGQHSERANPDFSVRNPAETIAAGVKWRNVTMFDEERGNRSDEAKGSCSEGLDSCLSYLLPILQKGESDLQLMAEPVQRLLKFNCAETVSKLCSISDAQSLLDLIFYIIHNSTFLLQYGPDAMRRALKLALEIYAKMPLIPRSLFLNGVNIEMDNERTGTLTDGRHKIKATFWHHSNGIYPMCQMALVWGTLSHENVLPLLGIYDATASRRGRWLYFVTPYMEHGKLRGWRQRVNRSWGEVRDRMLEVARAVQYIHSLGLVLCWLDVDHVFIDSNFRAKIRAYAISPQYLSDTPSGYMALPFSPESRTYEYNIFMFGCLYYEICFNVSIYEPNGEMSCREKVAKRPTQPKIHDDVWNLIQRCCAEDTKSRPTMDDIVEEMELWSFF